MTEEGCIVLSLSEEQLDAIVASWKGRRHELVTSFDGKSMMPAIAPGQSVRVLCGVEPEVGEVVVFHRGREIRVHRMVACGEAWRLTWGDANSLPDLPIGPTHLIGTISNIAPAPRSLRRALLLRILTVRNPTIERLARRIRLAYSVRAAWAQGPLAFARKSLRALARRQIPC